MTRLFLTPSPTRRGNELADKLRCRYHYLELNKYSYTRLFKEIYSLVKEHALIHVEVVDSFAFFIIVAFIKLFTKKTFIFDCHMVVFSREELSVIRYFIYRTVLKNQKIVFHNNTIAQNQRLTKDYLTLYTPVRSVTIPSYHSKYSIGILSNNYNDISTHLLERIIAIGYPVFMSGNVPVDLVKHKNVFAPGRLEYKDYLRNALSCEIILGLSDRDDCLVLVGREFLFYEKKVIVSDTRANRDHYGHHTDYIALNDNVDTIKEKIDRMISSTFTLSNYKEEYQDAFEKQVLGYDDFAS